MKRGFYIELNEPQTATYLGDLYFKIWHGEDLIHQTDTLTKDTNVILIESNPDIVYISNVDVGVNWEFTVSVHLGTSASPASDISKLYKFRAEFESLSWVFLFQEFKFAEDGDYLEMKVTFSDVTVTNPLLSNYAKRINIYQYNTSQIRFTVDGGAVNVQTFPAFVNDEIYVIRFERMALNRVITTVNGVSIDSTFADDIFANSYKDFGANAPGPDGGAGASPNYWLGGDIYYIDFNGDKMYMQQYEVGQYSETEIYAAELSSANGTDIKSLLS